MLGTLARAGVNDLRVVLAPTYPNKDLSLLAVAGIGLMTVLVDVLAVDARRPTLAGLPLVLLVAVPAAIRERSVGYLPLLAAAIGFLLLLSLDGQERTGRWGRVLPSPGAPMPSALASNAGAALQIGLASIALAVVVPLAIPGASHSPFGSSGGLGGNGDGHSNAVIIDPLVSVSAELHAESGQNLLTVQSPVPTYLRLTALERFTDSGFSLGPVSAPTSARVSKGLPAPIGVQVPGGPTVTETITASSALAEMLLPVPEGATSVKVHGDWRLASQTRTVFSSSETTSDSSWTVTATLPEPSASTLEQGGGVRMPAADYSPDLAGDLAFPADLPTLVASTARQWTAGQTTAYGAALAIQQHFTDGSFAYNTSVAFDPGTQGFSNFLDQRVGFCEQYATTMAAMLRTLGIPSRVAIGFVSGENSGLDTYDVTGADAHAWPEVWFQNVGWVRFEPTPRADAFTPNYAGQPGPGQLSPSPSSTSTAPSATPSASASTKGGSRNATRDRTLGITSRSSGGGGGGLIGGGVPDWVWVLVLAVVVAAVGAVPGASTALRRRRRLTDRSPGSTERVWAALLEDADNLGVTLSPAESPRGVGRRVLRTLSPAGPPPEDVRLAVVRLVRATERARYAADQPGASSDELAGDERTVRRAMTARLSRRARLGVLIAPVSARDRLREPLAAAVPAGLGALDRLFGARRRSRTRAGRAASPSAP
jgi:transglutaminase-like putative cysteine protease